MFNHARLFSFQFFTVKKPRFRNATKKTQGFAHIGVLNNSTIFPQERGVKISPVSNSTVSFST